MSHQLQKIHVTSEILPIEHTLAGNINLPRNNEKYDQCGKDPEK